ncbi:hypothetical protein N7460_012053 [Penicillium canescens]|uniref:Transmembrane protein n=1 Tax=Penicillium canescens TaxID=5083 RepID=A0AAD6N439_PENCN|nr:hypothetical protein N7460_012053 [Penicillium canescens]
MNAYDSASRGVPGCIMFLWSFTRIKHYATLGVVVTIIAVGIGPFVQQMATIENNLVPSDASASTDRAQSLFFPIDIRSVIPPSGMLAAMFGAVFASSEANLSTNDAQKSYPAVNPLCPTGECSISRFTTLSLCSECGGDGLPIDYFRLPNGFNASIEPSRTLHRHGSINQKLLKTDMSSGSNSMRSIAGLKDYGNSTLLDFTSLTFSLGGNTTKGTAVQCSLHWCIKTLSSVTKEHRTEEETLSTSVTPSATSTESGYLKLGSGNTSTPDFIISRGSHDNIREWLRKKLQMDGVGTTICIGTGFKFESTSTSIESELFQPLMESSPQTLFSNIAAGISTFIRQSGRASQREFASWGQLDGVPQDEALGTADGLSWQNETQIRVRWQWITLPVCLVFATVAFLVVTALQTKKSGVDVWKSSNIPMFCSGLDQVFQEKLRETRDPVRMDDLSEEVLAKLVKDGKMWQLSAQLN